MKNRISNNFHVPLNSLSVKTAKSSLARGHMGGGGGDWGYLELGPGTPPWVRVSIYKQKVLQDPGPNTHTAATIRKAPPQPPTPKKGVPRCGGGTGVKIQKNIEGSILVLK